MTLIKTEIDCCGNIIYFAEASGSGVSYTNTGNKVTSTSTATASSTESYEDAFKIAEKIAKNVAQSNAEHDANVINESLDISNEENNFANFTSTRYFKDLNSLNNFKLPTPKTNNSQFYNIITNIPNFEELGRGLNSYINTFVFDKDYSNLYVGGNFTYSIQIDGTQINTQYIARWNINEKKWYSLGLINPSKLFNYAGFNNTVHKLVFDNDFSNLYAGGEFTNVQQDSSIISTNCIAKFNIAQQTWYPLGINLSNANGISNTDLQQNSIVNVLIFDNNSNLYAGGYFNESLQKNGSNINTLNIARWNVAEETWYSLGTNSSNGLDDTVYTLVFDKDYYNLYIGGKFKNAYQNDNTITSINSIAMWNIGQQIWIPLGNNKENDNGLNNTVMTLVFDDNSNLYVGGSFTEAYQNDETILDVTCLVKWDGSVWSNIIKYDLSFITVTNLVFNNNNLYISGLLLNSNGMNYVVKWDGLNSSIASMSNFISDVYYIIFDNNNNLYIGSGPNNIALISGTISNKNVRFIYKDIQLNLINNDDSILSLNKQITSNQQLQTNILVFNKVKNIWELA